MTTDQIRGHIEASLLGGALGDALGYVIEFDRWRSIQEEYGPEGIQDLVPTRGKARISDDTQMTLFTAEGMLLGFERARETGQAPDTTADIYQAYLCRLQTQGYQASSVWDGKSRLLKIPEMNQLRAPGNTCLSALSSGRMGTLDEALNHSKGCGGVMRTAPLGFVRRGKERKSPFGPALVRGAEAAAITHSHSMGFVPAGMLSDMIDRCLYGGYGSLRALTEDSLEETLKTFAGLEEMDRFEDLMRRALSLSERKPGPGPETASVDEPAIRSLGEGWVGEEALAIAVYAALRYEKDLKKGLICAVNHRGDSDSTGAIAGNILGAWLGMEAVPEDWAARIELREEYTAIAEGMRKIIETD